MLPNLAGEIAVLPRLRVSDFAFGDWPTEAGTTRGGRTSAIRWPSSARLTSLSSVASLTLSPARG
jgi:hypothetical protein